MSKHIQCDWIEILDGNQAQCLKMADYIFEELQGQCREVALCDEHTYQFLNNPSHPVYDRTGQ